MLAASVLRRGYAFVNGGRAGEPWASQGEGTGVSPYTPYFPKELSESLTPCTPGGRQSLSCSFTQSRLDTLCYDTPCYVDIDVLTRQSRAGKPAHAVVRLSQYSFGGIKNDRAT